MANQRLVFDVLARTQGFESGMGKMQTKMSMVQRSALGLKSVMTGLFGGLLVLQAARKFLTTMNDFEREMSRVKAISGATAREFESLNKSAQLLGLSTRFTATEVAKLQTEFSKLGFLPAQIEKMSRATLNLASVAGSELAGSAAVVGSTIRVFQLEASDATHVVDVMAAAFSSSALDLEKFKVGMAIVAPIANEMGFSLEHTTALLAQLADKGIDASMSGTGLRRVFQAMAEDGGTLEDTFMDILTADNEVVAAFDKVGVRGAQIALALKDVITVSEGVAESWLDINGVAQDMSDTIEDNLVGDVKKFKSALEAAMLQAGMLGWALRGIVQAGTSVLQLMNPLGAKLAHIMGSGVEDLDELNDGLKEAKDLLSRVSDPVYTTYDPSADVDSLKLMIQTYEKQIEMLTKVQKSQEKLTKVKVPTKEYEEVTHTLEDMEPVAERLKNNMLDGFGAMPERLQAMNKELVESTTNIMPPIHSDWEILQARVESTVGAMEALSSLVNVSKQSFDSFGEKAVAVMKEVLNATIAVIGALVMMEAIKNPAKLVAGLTIGAAALGVVSSLLKPKQEVVVRGQISGNDITLSQNRTEQANKTTGAKVS